MFGKTRNGWIGVDIGTSAVKLAQVIHDVDGARLAQAAVIPRRRPWPDTMSDVLRSPIASNEEVHGAFTCTQGFTGRMAVCSMPMHVYDFRGLHIPSGTDAEQRTMIAGELAEKWDIFEEGCEFDFWDTMLPGVKLRQDEPNVHVLALSKPWSRQAVGDVTRAGLRCAVIDGPPLAAARAVGLVERKRGNNPVAMIDWGYTSTTFSVVVDSRPVFVRRIRGCGLRLVINAVMESFGVTLDQTHHLLQTAGLPDSEHADPDRDALAHAVADAAVEPLRQLADQINRTLAYFQAQRRALIPSKLWLLGGGASIPNAATFLGHDVTIPVEAWRLPGMTNNQDSHSIPLPLLAEAIGLSLMSLAA